MEQTPLLSKERRDKKEDKKGDKPRNQSRNQEEPENHDGTKTLSSKNGEPHCTSIDLKQHQSMLPRRSCAIQNSLIISIVTYLHSLLISKFIGQR